MSPSIPGSPLVPSPATAVTDRYFKALKTVGFTAWTTDPSGPTTAKVYQNGAGDFLYAAAVLYSFNAGDTVTGITFAIDTVATGAAPTALKVQLATVAAVAPPGNDVLTIVASVSAIAAMSGNVGLVRVPFGAPYTVPASNTTLYAVLSGRGSFGGVAPQIAGTTPDAAPVRFDNNRPSGIPLLRYQSITAGSGILGVGGTWSTWQTSSPNTYWLALY